MRYGQKLKSMLGGSALGLTLCITATSARADLSISDVPLFLAPGAEPNVMLMLDNSGSMTNIVPDAPYDPNVTYLSSCPSGNLVSTSTQVELRVNASGYPRVRIGSNNYVFGTSSGQRCFASNGEYLAKLYADQSNGTGISSYLPARYSGNYLNWYFNQATDPTGCSNNWYSGRKPCSKSRMMIAKDAGTTLVDLMSASIRVGLSTYSSSAQGGRLLQTVQPLTGAKRTSLKTSISGLSPEGQTPLAETLADIGWYFSRGASNLTLHPGTKPETVSRSSVFSNGYTRDSSWSNGDNPILYSCQKSFAVLLTDGRPQSDRAISSHLRDYTGDCANGLCVATANSTNLPSGPLPNTSYGNGTKVGRSYESQGSDYLDDVAMALYDIDLRPDLVSPLGDKNNLVSYFISFADDQAINDPLMKAAADLGGGEFFIAGNEEELTEAFKAAFQSIVKRTSSASSVATNSTRLDTETLVYQARFRSDDWTGQLLAYLLESDGTLGALQWDAATLIPEPDKRKIFTRKGTAPGAGNGIEFDFDDLSSDQQAALNRNGSGVNDGRGSLRVAWLRGDRTNEGSLFRSRSVVLGDIVNSDPVFVGAQNFGYDALPVTDGGGKDYIDYRQSKLAADGSIAKPMVYVGANDGMLHAFDGKTGVERFAYVPSTLIDDLSELTDTGYSHRYYVDGQIFVGDAYLDGDWTTVLVGTTGAGDRTVFALDVTDPHNFGASKVLWEFTDPDLGYTIGRPVVARMRDGTWVAVFGNGYNSDNDRAVLFIVNLETGALLRKIDTLAGSSSEPNGLASPVLLPDGTRSIQTIYAGDLLGNVWKFDVSSATSSEWKVAYENSGTPVPLFVATDSSGNRQPITAPMELGRHPQGGYMVYFGTGKFFETGDNVVPASPQVQTFYGIWDSTSGPITASRSTALTQQRILDEFVPENSAFEVRVTTDAQVDWSTRRGWYLDLLSPDGPEGERVVASPILRAGRIIFPTLIPSRDPCGFGGTSWLMEIEAISGSRLQQPPLDITEDGEINDDDFVTVIVDGERIRVPVSGVRSRQGIIRTPAVVSAGNREYKIASGTTGNIETLRERGLFDRARGSWRQLR